MKPACLILYNDNSDSLQDILSTFLKWLVMAIAFFDFDRTLIAANTANLWLKSLWKQGRLSPCQAASTLGWVVCYNLGFVPLESGLTRALGFLKGQPQDEFVAQVEHFYDAHVRDCYRAQAIQAIEMHRAKGDKVVLLTSSIHHLSDLVVKQLKLDYGISTVLGIDDHGQYTGTSVGPICFGKGKVIGAREYAVSQGVDLNQCTFYSDSMSDLPMMEAVGTAIAVSPDPRLKRRAEMKHWQIVDWDANPRA